MKFALALLLAMIVSPIVEAQCRGPFCGIRNRMASRQQYRQANYGYSNSGYGSAGGYSNQGYGSAGGYGRMQGYGSAGGYGGQGNGSAGGYNAPAPDESRYQNQQLPGWPASSKPKAVKANQVKATKASKCGNPLCECEDCQCGPDCPCGKKLTQLPPWKEDKLVMLPPWKEPSLDSLPEYQIAAR